MKTLEVKFKKESDRVSLMGALVAVGYTSRVGMVDIKDVQEILDDTPYTKWPILLVKAENKISFRMSSSNSPEFSKNWPEDAKDIIEYFINVPVKIKLTNDYDAVVNTADKIVNVGCQRIPFDKIDELYKAIHAQDA